jgi:hypothetical protein
MKKQSVFWASLLVVGLACGCGKQGAQTSPDPAAKAPQPDSETTDAGAPTHGPGPSVANPPPAVIPDQVDTGATLSRLSLELRKYVMRTRSAPRNFEEFVALSHIQAPSAPSGKKYAIQGGAVVLTKL